MNIQLSSKNPLYIAAKNIVGDHRKVFDSLSDALTMLRAIYAIENFPPAFPSVAAGVGLIDCSGEDTIPPLDKFPAEYSTAGTSTCLSFLGVRGIKEGDKEVNGARGFVLYPLHSIDAIRADSTGENWLWKITEKEGSHVALRGLRNVAPALGNDALAQAALQMPVAVADYVEESTREGLDSTAFDELWKTFRKMLSESGDTAALVPQLPVKAEVIRAIRSQAYARENYPDLEAIQAFTFIGETMAGVIDFMRSEATKAGNDFTIDSAEIRNWIKGRETFMFAAPRKVETDLSTLNFGSFVTKLGVAVPVVTGEAGESSSTTEGADAGA